MKLACYSQPFLLYCNETTEASLVLLVVVAIVKETNYLGAKKCPSGLHTCVYAPFVNILPILFQHNSSTFSNAYCSQNYASIMCQVLGGREEGRREMLCERAPSLPGPTSVPGYPLSPWQWDTAAAPSDWGSEVEVQRSVQTS